MNILRAPDMALGWLGRQGTRAVALSVFIGIALPQLGAVFKPYLGPIVFALLMFSFLRVDPSAVWRTIKQPRLAILAALWVMIVTPALFGAAFHYSGLLAAMPGLAAVLILQMATAPITSSGAIAALIGLDVALALVGLILCSAMAPLVTPAFSYLFLGSSLFSPAELGLKLFLLFAGSAALSMLLRWWAGKAWIERQSDHIDGLNVIAIFIFAVSAMEGVTDYALAEPWAALGILALAFLFNLGPLVITALLFARAGRDRAVVIGLFAANRNLGTIMATVGPALPPLAWFYFAMVQFPILLMPMVLQALAPRIVGHAAPQESPPIQPS